MPCSQALADGGGTDGSQVAVGQRVAGFQNEILPSDVRATVLVWGVRVIGPVHAVQTLAFGPRDPVGDGGDADAKLAGDGTQRLASSDCGYHVSTPLRLSFCLLMGFPLDGSVLEKL